MRDYRSYIMGPKWATRRRRHLARHPWCMAHGQPCRARTVHHASYLCWRLFGRELPFERVSLCHPVHDRISAFHRGGWVPSLWLFLVTWAVIGWVRAGMLLGGRR